MFLTIRAVVGNAESAVVAVHFLGSRGSPGLCSLHGALSTIFSHSTVVISDPRQKTGLMF